MSNTKPEIGIIGWTDLTIVYAEEIRDFYSKVVGWKPQPRSISIGQYDDYVMNALETRNEHCRSLSCPRY